MKGGQDPYRLTAKSRLHTVYFLAWMMFKLFVAPSSLLRNTLSIKLVLVHIFSTNSTLDTSLVRYI